MITHVHAVSSRYTEVSSQQAEIDGGVGGYQCWHKYSQYARQSSIPLFQTQHFPRSFTLSHSFRFLLLDTSSCSGSGYSHSFSMKTAALIAALAALAAASPVGDANVVKRSTKNELTDGSCRKVTFIMARGSTEVGNMVCWIISVSDQIMQS